MRNKFVQMNFHVNGTYFHMLNSFLMFDFSLPIKLKVKNNELQQKNRQF